MADDVHTSLALMGLVAGRRRRTIPNGSWSRKKSETRSATRIMRSQATATSDLKFVANSAL